MTVEYRSGIGTEAAIQARVVIYYSSINIWLLRRRLVTDYENEVSPTLLKPWAFKNITKMHAGFDDESNVYQLSLPIGGPLINNK